MAFTIAMSNEKGGVAKTTSTLSLGAALAELNHRVLLIDLDPQANLSLALGLENGEAEMTSANVLIENKVSAETAKDKYYDYTIAFEDQAHVRPFPHSYTGK